MTVQSAGAKMTRSSEVSTRSRFLVNFGSMQPVYYIHTYNGFSLVDQVFQALGWKRTTDRFVEQVRVRWTEVAGQIGYAGFREGEQAVNHIPNCGLITNKLGLLMCLRQFEHQFKLRNNRLPTLLVRDFLPETYVLDDPRERAAFLDNFRDDQIWINKPIGLNQGKGIYLVRDRHSILAHLQQRDREARESRRGIPPRIIQRYITNPLLLEGRKFDIRCFMFVANSIPYLVLYHPGYVRLCLNPYSAEDTSLFSHLTNQFIQKKDPNYEHAHESTVWSMSQLNDYVNKHVMPHKKIDKNWVFNTLEYRMQRIMYHVFNSVRCKLASRVGLFELFGFDFMVDENMRVWLIEVNTNPAMHTNCSVLDDVLPPLMEKCIHVTLECFEKAKRKKQLLPLHGLAPWSASALSNISIRKPERLAEMVEESSSAVNSNGQIFPWTRSEYNGLPQSFVILVNESQQNCQNRVAMSSTIPLRLWIHPTYRPMEKREPYIITNEAEFSLESTTANRNNTGQSNTVHNSNASTALPMQSFGSTAPHRESGSLAPGETKIYSEPYKNMPFENSLRRYAPIPANQNQSKKSSTSNPKAQTSSLLDKKVHDAYKTAISARTSHKLSSLPGPRSGSKGRPPLQTTNSRSACPKRENSIRIPAPITTVQVVTNGPEKVVNSAENPMEPAPVARFPSRKLSIRQNNSSNFDLWAGGVNLADRKLINSINEKITRDSLKHRTIPDRTC